MNIIKSLHGHKKSVQCLVLKKVISLNVLFKHIVLQERYSSTQSNGLLKDINVLDLTRIIAGPYCSMMFGDLGANVIKVEHLEGDESRKWGPPFIEGSSDSYYFLAVNRNKKSICVDFKTDEGKSIIYDLAKKCDVLIENFVPGKLDDMNLGYEKLSSIVPQLIFCSITGYGPTGPYAKRPGYDVIAAGTGGLINVTGERDGDPVKVGVPITDITTGLHAFGAIMTALYHRQITGRGQKIDCNLLSTQVASMIHAASTYLNADIEPQRWGTQHPSIVPYQAFQTQNGYIIIGAGSNSQFSAFCRLLNREELISDVRYSSNQQRVENRLMLVETLTNTLKMKKTKEWLKIFKDAPFPNGPINTMKDVFEDEHIKAIGIVQELQHPIAGPVKVVAERSAILTLRPQRERKKVLWSNETVDNEHMDKKKSKCCCIFIKKKKFGESDSEDDEDEADHCLKHVEKKRARQELQHQHNQDCQHSEPNYSLPGPSHNGHPSDGGSDNYAK